MGRPGAFAILHTWPDLKNAEYEVLHRLLGAAERVGARAVVVDPNGRILWAHSDLDLAEGEPLPPDAVDFLISMHFQTGRVLDCYSYFTLWQPVEFYHDFGYQSSIDKVTSYNDLLSCDSDLADAHGLNLLTALGRAPKQPLLKMFHALPEPYLEPRISQTSNPFYIGINWERLGRPKGRFHDVFVTLDRHGMVDIYGPELILGEAPWQGFKGYKGELPFDGVSVKHAINRAGICLVLSSAVHKRNGIMSNRLFEGLAGGAAIIASPNAIIDKYFRDVVYPVDDAQGETVLTQQIIAAVRQIRADPVEAARRTREGQRIMREQCSLEESIRILVAATPERKAHFQQVFLDDCAVTVIVRYEGDAIDELRDYLVQFERQDRARVTVVVLCSDRFARRHGAALALSARGSITDISARSITFTPRPTSFDAPRQPRKRSGAATAEILRQVKTPLFAFFSMNDHIFSDHFASAAKVLNTQPDAAVAAVGRILQTDHADRTQTRVFESARFVDTASIYLVNGDGDEGRFVYRSSLLVDVHDHLMAMLDGEEHSYFRLAGALAGPLAQTNYGTYVRRQPGQPALQPAEPIEFQRQYIRDAFMRDPRWLKALSTGAKIPEFVYAYSPGTTIRWSDYRAPPAIAQRMTPNVPNLTRIGGEGLKFLSSGFSQPEAEIIWLDAERGVIDFTVDRAAVDEGEGYRLLLTAAGRRSLQTGRHQHATIAVNGMVVGYAEIPEVFTEVAISIPLHLLQGIDRFRVELIPDHSDQVFDGNGKLTDPRRLSIQLKSLTVQSVRQRMPPIFAPDTYWGCGEGMAGTLALAKHFHRPEAVHSWIAGRVGHMWFRLTRMPAHPELRLHLCGRISLATGALPRVTVTANGKNLGTHLLVLSDGEGDLAVDLSGVDLSARQIDLILETSHAEAVYDSSHNIIDNRLLGIGVITFGVFDRDEVDIAKEDDSDEDSISEDDPAEHDEYARTQ